MALPPEFVPQPADRGLVSASASELAAETVNCWHEFAQMARDLDLDAPTRAQGRVRDILAKVGDWPEGRRFPDILADALAGVGGEIDQDAVDERVLAARASESRSSLLAAIERCGQHVADWESGALAVGQPFLQTALLPVASPLGDLPVLTYAHAAAFQLAVSAHDLVQAGAVVPRSLERAGLRALLDTTGALAARMDISAAVAVVTPQLSLCTVSENAGWITAELPDHVARKHFPGVEGRAGLILDVAAGRVNPVRRMHKREIKLRELGALLKLAPIAEDVAGLPGGAVMRKAASFLSRFA